MVGFRLPSWVSLAVLPVFKLSFCYSKLGRNRRTPLTSRFEVLKFSCSKEQLHLNTSQIAFPYLS